MNSPEEDASHITPHVGLFVTCLVDLHRPGVGFAAIKLLEQAGCLVSVPDSQTCCGQPAFNSGDDGSSRQIAMNTIMAFEGFDYIVVPSGSCAGMMIEHYPALFKDEPAWLSKAKAFSDRCHELLSFLVDVRGMTDFGARFDQSVTYHDSCSGLRELGIHRQPRQLMQDIEGLELTEMQDTDVCCGFGGTFCVKYPDISERMVSDKVALASQTGASTLLGGDMGCLLNISGRLCRLDQTMSVYHVAEVLAGMADGPAIGKGSGVSFTPPVQK
ncbi:MAG: (Fe-S)-binding protein [Granulosicoccus sp.]